MSTPHEVRWRLRIGHQIVGYERHIGGRVWSSSDGFWWRGERLDYNMKDRCFDSKDVNNKWLFDGDVVTWPSNSGRWILKWNADGWQMIQDGTTVEAPHEHRVLRHVGHNF